MEVLRGYLSLHQAGDNLTLKWTPNQLINGTMGDCDLEKRLPVLTDSSTTYWLNMWQKAFLTHWHLLLLASTGTTHWLFPCARLSASTVISYVSILCCPSSPTACPPLDASSDVPFCSVLKLILEAPWFWLVRMGSSAPPCTFLQEVTSLPSFLV